MALRQEVLLYNPAEEAVADAMMVTQAKMLLEPLKQGGISSVNIGAMLGNISHGICGKASIYALAYLAKMYVYLFDYMFLIQARLTAERDFYKAGLLQHVLFAVRDKGGMWFAGSPANHNSDVPKDENSMTRIIRGNTLAEIISVIEKKEGGLWPSADFIEAQIPTYYGHPKIYEISKDGKNKKSLEVCIASYDASGQKFFQSDPLPIPKELKFKPDLPFISNVQLMLWR